MKTYDGIEGWFDWPEFYRWLAEKAPPNSTIVEVGTWMGASAIYLAYMLRIEKSPDAPLLYCVDTFSGGPEQPEHVATLQLDPGFVFRRFVANYQSRGLGDVIVPIVSESVKAARLFRPHSVYAVYIDAAHDYESVTADLLAWLPKVQPGGIIAGHDYNPAWGVKRAVDEMFGERVQLSDVSTWWVQL